MQQLEIDCSNVVQRQFTFLIPCQKDNAAIHPNLL